MRMRGRKPGRGRRGRKEGEEAPWSLTDYLSLLVKILPFKGN